MNSLLVKKIAIYLFFILNLAVIFYFWGLGSGTLLFSGSTADALISFSRLTGLLAAFFVLLQVVLIVRVPWLESVFGLDKLSVIHHWNGLFSLIFILAHPVLIIFASSIFLQQTFFGALKFITSSSDELLSALVAVIVFVAMVALSLIIIKKRLKYEVWYFTHLFTYLAIILAFGHQLELGGDFVNQHFAAYWHVLYILTIGHLILFRLARPWRNFFRFRFKVLRLEQETEEAVSIYITGKNFSNFKYQPGQFMIFRFLNKHVWRQAHPFSISSMPNGEYLRITVKNLGDFTGSIKEKIKPGDFVWLEGPYGIFTSLRSSKKKILLIAGGVGIAPLRPLAEDLLKQGKDVVLVYASKNLKNLIFKNELEALSQNAGLRTHLVLSEEMPLVGEKGRLNKEVLTHLVPDLKDREVYLCGPQGLTQTLLKELSLKPSLLHYEKFSLS